jgi:hypothetical protein
MAVTYRPTQSSGSPIDINDNRGINVSTHGDPTMLIVAGLSLLSRPSSP